MNFAKFTTYTLLILSVHCLNAAEKRIDTTTGLTNLSDYLGYGAIHNQELKAAFYNWQASIAKITRVQGLPDPKFTYVHFIENVETRVGPQKRKYGLMQMFPWFGKLSLKGERALAASKELEQKYEATKLKLFFKIKTLYSEYYYIAKARETTQHNIDLVRYFESVARTKYMAGRAPHSSIIRSQVELGKLEDKLISLQEMQVPIVAQINTILNRNLSQTIPWPKTIPLTKVVFTEHKLEQSLLNNNPRLKALGHMETQRKKSIALAQKRYFPDFTLGVNYVDTAEAKMAGVMDSGKDPMAVTLSINIPLWFSKYGAGVDEATASFHSISHKREQAKSDLTSQLKMSLYRYKDAIRKINLYRDTLIPKGKQSLKVTQQSFEAGKVDFLSLIDAQRVLVQFELMYQKSLAERYKHLAKIEMLIGKNL
ncbi:MAG: TolC family protein [Bdellovibrionales bacterium]|jgi:outer membrane protein, heavy metal efflux system|nr:TolC family protein [Bdellovibrionales bacterium]MBT3525368.1 TolC family protein [Bdellovibrionales bacterium]MBT7670455.1 TolC family protein [Bdellovibrionales bacterium]MBT7766613.1 TolC family protein [Bdellovibrionales bacterium]